MLFDYEPVVLDEAANPLAYEVTQEEENLTEELEKSIYFTAETLMQSYEKPMVT